MTELGEELEADGLLLLVDRASGVRTKPVGGRDEEPKADDGPIGLCEERVDVGLLDGVRRRVRLCLDGPDAAIAGLRD